MAKKKPANPAYNNPEGFPILGWLANWSTRNLTIHRDELVKKLNSVGIPGEIARETLPKNAVKRAVQDVVKKLMPGTQYEKLRFTPEDGKDKMVVVIVEADCDSKGDTTFNQVSKTIFDKMTHTVKVEGKFAKEIEEEFNVKRAYYSSDQFRTIVLRYAKRYCAAVTYLETGNIYFVPVSMKDNLEKLQKLFKVIGGEAKLVTKEEINTKQVRSVMWDVTVGEVEQQVKKMREELEDLPDEMKENSVDIRLKRFDDLRTKVEMFETVLQGKADKLKDELAKLTKTIKEKVVN